MANEIERGRRMLREYLNSVSQMSVKSNRMLFKMIENEYLRRMEDEAYFDMMSRFLNRRKPKAEKEAFCYAMVRDLIASGDIKRKVKEAQGDRENQRA